MERIYCSQAAQGETLSGTADQVDVWLMLEYRPSWGARVVDDNDLSEDVRRWLSEQVGRLRDRGLVVRPQFIRQPEIDRSDTRLLLGFDDTLTMVSCEGYRDLLDLHLCDVLDEGATQVLTEPNYFVCTNGQRDLCCARFGLPAYAALREIAGERA